MPDFSNIKIIQLFGLLFISLSLSFCQTHEVLVKSNEHGNVLIVNGEKFIINGMNWDMIPIGKDAVSANFWKSSDEIIKLGLDHEMSLLKDMNINTIRHYSDIPAKWIQYIYENYGIYTMINHSFGRYGMTVDGKWNPPMTKKKPNVKFCYALTRKSDPWVELELSDEDAKKYLAQFKFTVRQMEALLSLSDDKDTIINAIPHNPDTFYWNNAEEIAATFYGT